LARARASAYLAAVTAWLLWIVALPLLLQAPHVPQSLAVAAAFTYRVGSVVCHQDPERSFTFGGIPIPVCARCTGLYAGAVLGALAALHAVGRRRRPAMGFASVRLALIACALPTALLWLAEWLIGVRVGNLARWTGALPLGAAVSWVIGLAIAGTLPTDTHGPSGVH
jgi:uncharacterized membrane protein